MTDLTERVARALCLNDHEEPDLMVGPLGDEGIFPYWHLYRRAAEFAIAAIDGRPVPDGEIVRIAKCAPDEQFDLVAHLHRQREFSLRTFGPGPRTLGVTDHIAKELDEIRADPTDIAEWVDVIILAFDGAWRAGWEPEDIVAAIVAKQTKNEGRTWPDWRKSDPNKAIEHDRSRDAP